ncbi:MAG: hypothetical protein ACE5IK_06905 [Acidobacteriota bacterium]
MVPLTDLWLPVLLSAILVFIASSIIHMVLPYHRGDYQRLPAEAQLLEAMRKEQVRPGNYIFPCPASHKELASPEMIRKYEQGPVGFLNVVSSGRPVMGKHLTVWFIYCLVIGSLTAYLTGRTLAPGTDYLAVFRVAGTVGFLGYAGAHPVASIWKGQKWTTTLKFLFDGLVYGSLAAGCFGWLWPAA